jgi:hypothetical protein
MTILAAIKREEKRVKKQLAKLQHELGATRFWLRCRVLAGVREASSF